MNSLDSRYLRLGDTFAHRFTRPGSYHYSVDVPGCLAPPADQPGFEIIVAEERGEKSTTHYVSVSYAAGRFSVSPDKLRIRNNDVILWSTTSPATPGYSVNGASRAARFDSATMPANSMYSHAFGTSGTFAWQSPSDPALNGTVTVAAHPPCLTEEHRTAYLKKLSQGVLVMIDDPKVHPKKVSVSVGQTVFFAVRSGAAVAIVDRALLKASEGAINPQPLPP